MLPLTWMSSWNHLAEKRLKESNILPTPQEFGTWSHTLDICFAYRLESPSRAVRDRIDDNENEYPRNDSSAKFLHLSLTRARAPRARKGSSITEGDARWPAPLGVRPAYGYGYNRRLTPSG